jgi:(p)ppGpp synthase/HD superfamily hydrolase
MNKVAESGVAAHWVYKANEESIDQMHAGAREWMRELLEMQTRAGNSLEFLENVKIDLFPDAVYVFTPAGEIMKLPYGATVIDFAYAVHTDVGNTCIDAKVDRQAVPLRTVLHNGQTVEIVTAAGACPNPAWLNFAVSAKARSNIRHYQKSLKREEAIELGRRMLDRALGVFEVTEKDISKQRLRALLKDYQLKTFDDLLVEMGMGRRPAVLVARALVPVEDASLKGDDTAMRPLVIKGTEGMVTRFSKCCRPIPGDPVIGVITGGRGLMIHAQNCRNITDSKYPPENYLDVQWEPAIDEEFPVEVNVAVEDRRGVLAMVATVIGDSDSNIENVGIEERDGLTNNLRFTITVHNRQHLARVMRRVHNIPSVIKITRVKG